MSAIRHRTVSVDGLEVFVREAGGPNRPTPWCCCRAIRPAPVPTSG